MSAMAILKWVGGIVASIVAALIVTILVMTANAVASHGSRITALEVKSKYAAESDQEIKDMLRELTKKVDSLQKR